MVEQMQSDDIAPRIGISACMCHADAERELYNGRPLLYLEQSMATWLMRAGARPYLVPTAPEATRDEHPISLEAMVEGLEGLVLHGGVDVAPESYGEEPEREAWAGDRVRDVYEMRLVDACLARSIPVLGICRGIQVLNVALGGTLYQDVGTQLDGAIAHRNPDVYDDHVHPVVFEPDSRLAELHGGIQRAIVNSVHHQAVRDLGDSLIVEARSETDGVVEAVRHDPSVEEAWYAGVQWHPEFQDPDDDELLDPMPLIADFLAACRTSRSG